MWSNLARLARHRTLIQSLVARELTARYRGSVLGFFWSFVNPLLLLLIYAFVFGVLLPNRAVEPYALFLFCGILPWTWFSASLMESSGSLLAGGNLIKRVLLRRTGADCPGCRWSSPSNSHSRSVSRCSSPHSRCTFATSAISSRTS